MAEYVLHHTHGSAQCREMSQAWKAPDAPTALKGHQLYRYCRSGDHGEFILVEAASPEAALALLPALLRPTTRVYAGQRSTIEAGTAIDDCGVPRTRGA